MSAQYLDGAEPLFIEGSNTGYLLLHGAGGGTTWDLKEFAHLLHSETGATILLPALKGFGTRPEDLFDVSFTDWMTDAREGFKQLHQNCVNIFVVGHSMGGILTLLLASEQKEVTAITTWAAAISVKNRLLSFLPIINKDPLIKKVIPEKYTSPAPVELKAKGWIGYDWIPTSLGLVILEGLKQVKKSLHKVTCPAFIIQGTADEAVSYKSAKIIYDSIKSSTKKLWYVEGASHPIMNEDLYKGELFSRTIHFFQGLE
ncbi:MAG: alpha/beta fold hydrolase [Candidatus Heimdallarchaeota archaeon]|nr:MAG: alpha/beta fold hydrolase [Candidatus Heimdallarchaeota archaeon]